MQYILYVIFLECKFNHFLIFSKGSFADYYLRFPKNGSSLESADNVFVGRNETQKIHDAVPSAASEIPLLQPFDAQCVAKVAELCLKSGPLTGRKRPSYASKVGGLRLPNGGVAFLRAR